MIETPQRVAQHGGDRQRHPTASVDSQNVRGVFELRTEDVDQQVVGEHRRQQAQRGCDRQAERQGEP